MDKLELALDLIDTIEAEATSDFCSYCREVRHLIGEYKEKIEKEDYERRNPQDKV